ncbi:hypothetical protein HK107_03715 [Parvularcula sp. ZS-1/3]|uniref:Lipoprotein n=1 Tax=Parvularcula mediterranea TaxID=2732508 RepID=A0A7Y3RJX7_9PROT|nr:DUF6491 family protein [Parvularcula mediterranea]NNU15433.1 hypothetical protein [Parvularcula mediterranea]
MRAIGCCLLATVLLSSCASTDSGERLTVETDPKVGEQIDSICFSRAINGFSQWGGRDGLVLTRGVNDKFLVTFVGPCPEARNALRIGFDRRFAGSGCVRPGNLIYMSSSFSAGGANPLDSGFCRVGRVYEYDRKTDEAE